MDRSVDAPGSATLEAFELRGVPRRLADARGGTFVIGRAVLKAADDPAEAALVQELASRLAPTTYRIAPPLRAAGGGWTHDGWTANELVPGLRPAAPDWAAIVCAGDALALDVEAVRGDLDLGALAHRTHPWARADRRAWDEEEVVLDGPAEAIVDVLREAANQANAAAPRELVHADLSGNVHRDEQGTPVVLDLSLYLRPRRWAAAVVTVDALLWHTAPIDLAEAFFATPAGRDLLARAATFRLVADALVGGPLASDDLGRYRRLASLLVAS